MESSWAPSFSYQDRRLNQQVACLYIFNVRAGTSSGPSIPWGEWSRNLHHSHCRAPQRNFAPALMTSCYGVCCCALSSTQPNPSSSGLATLIKAPTGHRTLTVYLFLPTLSIVHWSRSWSLPWLNTFLQTSNSCNIEGMFVSPQKNPTASLYYWLSLTQNTHTLPYPDTTRLLQFGTLWSPGTHTPSFN